MLGLYTLSREREMTSMSAQALLVNNRLLQAVISVQTAFIHGHPAPRLFEPLLSVLLELTGSEEAFIAEVEREAPGEARLRPLARMSHTWVSWQGELPTGEGAHCLLHGVMQAGRPMMSNRPVNAETRSLLGLALLVNQEVVGVLGLANRPGGYHDSLITFVEPCLPPCGALVAGLRAEHHRRRAEQQQHSGLSQGIAP
jgi:two-component system NtrC family sensor kinase